MLCLLAGLAACCPSVGSDTHRLLGAVAALEVGRLAEAIEAAKSVARVEPGGALALNVRGTGELLMYSIGAARESFELAHRRQPEGSCALLGLAACAAAERRWDAAAAAYERALARDCYEPALALTSLAFATLAAGDARSALEQANRARGEHPGGPLADQVAAMAHVALGDTAAAEASLRRCAGTAAPLMHVVLTPLHVYPSGEPLRAALAEQPEPVTTASALRPGEDALWRKSSNSENEGSVSIVSPRGGAAVSGTVRVQIGGTAYNRLGYVVLLVDGKFRAVRNLPPFRLALDTKTCSDGGHSLEVKGYDRRGALLGSHTVTVFVNNGVRHTADPAAAEARRELIRRLERCLALRPHPLNQPYLMGRILDRQGRLADAITAFEYVFSMQPTFPGVHPELIDAYGRHGLLAGSGGARVIRQLPAGSGQVALTFDDGPGPAVTPWILDRLDEADAKATFFIVGKQAELYPHLVAEIRRRGHELACHGYSHTDLSELSIIEIERELVKTRAIVRQTTGDLLRYFRPPGGNHDLDVQRAVGEMGYTTVFWSTAVTDFLDQPTERVLALMSGKIEDGAIVLLHNGFDATVDVLPELLSILKKREYKFVTLSEGLGTTSPPARAGYDRPLSKAGSRTG